MADGSTNLFSKKKEKKKCDLLGALDVVCIIINARYVSKSCDYRPS